MPLTGRTAIALVLGASCAAGLAAGGLIPSTAGAKTFPPPIQGNTYYYVAPKKLLKPMRIAARSWNRAKVGYKFKRTRSSEQANLIIYATSRDGGCGGFARANPVALGIRAEIELDLSYCSTRLSRVVVAHELGHILNLGHVRGRCHLMSAIGYACSPVRPERSDIRKVRRFARYRNKLRRKAPTLATLSLKSGKYEFENDDGYGEMGLWVALTISGTWKHAVWDESRISVNPSVGHTKKCRTFDSKRDWLFLGPLTYRPRGWAGTALSCFTKIREGDGPVSVTATALSTNGLRLTKTWQLNAMAP